MFRWMQGMGKQEGKRELTYFKQLQSKSDFFFFSFVVQTQVKMCLGGIQMVQVDCMGLSFTTFGQTKTILIRGGKNDCVGQNAQPKFDLNREVFLWKMRSCVSRGLLCYDHQLRGLTVLSACTSTYKWQFNTPLQFDATMAGLAVFLCKRGNAGGMKL